MAGHKIKFSIITATYNAAEVLPRLIASLQAQTDQDFEWVVADGASTDGTLALLEEAGQALNVRVDSRPDFGIYDALNRAVKMAEGDYYLVVGADDELFPDAVGQYKSACQESEADLVTAKIEINGSPAGVRRFPLEWLYGPFAYVSGHAVGLAIRKSAHEAYGYYSNKFPIAADQLFILKVIHGRGRVRQCDFISGRYFLGGASGADSLGCMLESYRIQCLVGHNFILQSAILFIRLIKNSWKINNYLRFRGGDALRRGK
ncbi:glycosyltransferase [Castellaniella sp.]|uniref:glycosyltransferase n=1 Tax=Castellaniella sp. TaxID=1955812 RepID=UPI002AFDE206|nr:glycosyltransferase [Castellaniella sp.]